jgi:uncharacterized protein (TIGR02217 family)
VFIESPVFPDYRGYGLRLVPSFATDLIQVRSGFEGGNQRWSQPLRTFDGATAHRTQAERAAIEAFFVSVAKGRANQFRLRDITDYKDEGRGVVTLVSGNVYQLGKTYTSGAQIHTRDIRKPRSGEVSVQGGGSYSLDFNTGRVTHTGGGAPTGWTGLFDAGRASITTSSFSSSPAARMASPCSSPRAAARRGARVKTVPAPPCRRAPRHGQTTLAAHCMKITRKDGTIYGSPTTIASSSSTA